MEEVVIALHRRQPTEHRGVEGLRDRILLLSGLDRPQNLWAYSEGAPDLAALAAAYGFGIARNHPFVDGNKRTALVVCRTFLKLNASDLVTDQEDKYRTFLALAEGSLSEEALTEWIRQRSPSTQGEKS
ncbi:MAG: type II toxin-antitoxin system death-on-curing family toxin [Chthonomonadaceae bacterium]|nr:type II toxin-antitoxin system death-on-curing family toxin [Chthonomonadaceae bacterium]